MLHRILWLSLLLGTAALPIAAAEMPRVRLADDRRGFILADSGQPFIPWGFNYDHDEQGLCWRTTGTRSGRRSRRTFAR